MLIFLAYICQKHTVTTLAFVGYMTFLILHVIAAHYLYSYVPYNDWLIKLFDFDLDKTFGFERNMFDRLVHFSFGFCLYPFLFMLCKLWAYPLQKSLKIHVLTIGLVVASSAIYELIEWGIAIGLSPEEAENYNGQQGDMWDAHKDMFLATLGSIIASLLMLKKQKPINQLMGFYHQRYK